MAPGDAYDEVLARLADDLRSLVDPVTGEPAVEEVLRHDDLFGEVPGRLPDLFVRWRPHTHVLRRAIHPSGEIEAPELGYRRESFHRMEGVVAAAGPSVEGEGDLGSLDPLGFAPTCLRLLGRPVPDAMDGSPWPGVAPAGPP